MGVIKIQVIFQTIKWLISSRENDIVLDQILRTIQVLSLDGDGRAAKRTDKLCSMRWKVPLMRRENSGDGFKEELILSNAAENCQVITERSI